MSSNHSAIGMNAKLAAVAVVVVVFLICVLRSGSGSSGAIRVLHRSSGQHLFFEWANRKGYFTNEGLKVRLSGTSAASGRMTAAGWSRLLERIEAGEIEILVGCPASVLLKAGENPPGRWTWFGRGLETLDGEELSAVYVKRQNGITNPAVLRERIESGQAVLAVPDDVWGGESRQIWKFKANASPVVLETVTADLLAHHAAAAVFGDSVTLRILERDPRFVCLEKNLRARYISNPYWESANVVSRSYAEQHPQVLSSCIRAVERARKDVESDSSEALSFRRDNGFMSARGEKIGVATNISEASVEGDAVGLVSQGNEAKIAAQDATTKGLAGLSAARDMPARGSEQKEVLPNKAMDSTPTAAPERLTSGIQEDSRVFPPFSEPMPKDVLLNKPETKER